MTRPLFFLSLLSILLVTVASAQSPDVKINVISPPASLPPCRTGLKSVPDKGGLKTTFSVFIPRTLELDLSATTVAYSTNATDYIFSFAADSGTCVTTANSYDISFSGAAQTVSIKPAAAPPQTPSAPPVENLASTAAEATKDKDDAKEVDFSIPESPAFTILGINPQEVTRPATPRDFATAIINSLDRNGNLQHGIAIDTAPYQLLFGKSITNDAYAKSFFVRLLWRSQLSLGTTKGSSDTDKSARVGLGLNTTLFDRGDPSLDKILAKCDIDLDTDLLEEAYRALGFTGSSDPNKRAGDVAKATALQKTLITQKYLKKLEKCADDSEKRNFGRSSFGIGMAGSWISKNGDTSKFVHNGEAIWTSLAYGFEGIPGLRCTEAEITETTNRCVTPQLIFHFRRRVKETVPDPLATGIFTTKDSNLFGTRLRIGVPQWSLNLEGVYSGEHYAGRKPASKFEVSFGTDYRLSKDLYLNFSIGGETKASNIDPNKKVFIRTSFNWGVAQKPIN